MKKKRYKHQIPGSNDNMGGTPAAEQLEPADDSAADNKRSIVCEHLLRQPELPCFHNLEEPICETDSGHSFLCLACVGKIKAGFGESLQLHAICHSHCDEMTVERTFDVRRPSNEKKLTDR